MATVRSVAELEAEMKGLVGTVRVQQFHVAPKEHLWAGQQEAPRAAPRSAPGNAPMNGANGRIQPAAGSAISSTQAQDRRSLAGPPPSYGSAVPAAPSQHHNHQHGPHSAAPPQRSTTATSSAVRAERSKPIAVATPSGVPPPAYKEAVAAPVPTPAPRLGAAPLPSDQSRSVISPRSVQVGPPPTYSEAVNASAVEQPTKHSSGKEKKDKGKSQHKDKKKHSHHSAHSVHSSHSSHSSQSSHSSHSHKKNHRHQLTPTPEAAKVEVENRQTQIEAERSASDLEEKRFVARRDTNKEGLGNGASAVQVADRLTTLTVALRHALAQLLLAVKDVDAQKASPTAIDGATTNIRLLMTEVDSLVVNVQLKLELQLAVSTFGNTVANLATLYRNPHPSHTALNAQRSELKRAIEGLTTAVNAAVKAAQPEKKGSGIKVERTRSRGSSIAEPHSTTLAPTPAPTHLTRLSHDQVQRLSVEVVADTYVPEEAPGLTRSRNERMRQQKALAPLPGFEMCESLSSGIRAKTKAPGAELWVPPFFASYEKLKREVGAPCPIPGIDGSRLEAYLKDEEFEIVFHMSKQEFYQLPPWRQRAIKINRKLW